MKRRSVVAKDHPNYAEKCEKWKITKREIDAGYSALQSKLPYWGMIARCQRTKRTVLEWATKYIGHLTRILEGETVETAHGVRPLEILDFKITAEAYCDEYWRQKELKKPTSPVKKRKVMKDLEECAPPVKKQKVMEHSEKPAAPVQQQEVMETLEIPAPPVQQPAQWTPEQQWRAHEQWQAHQQWGAYHQWETHHQWEAYNQRATHEQSFNN